MGFFFVLFSIKRWRKSNHEHLPPMILEHIRVVHTGASLMKTIVPLGDLEFYNQKVNFFLLMLKYIEHKIHHLNYF